MSNSRKWANKMENELNPSAPLSLKKQSTTSSLGPFLNLQVEKSLERKMRPAAADDSLPNLNAPKTTNLHTQSMTNKLYRQKQ